MPEYAYTKFSITTHSEDWVTLSTETNDNFDYGYPTEFAQWIDEYRGENALEKCLKHTGKSRQGIGHRVFVTLDGKEI